MIRRPPRSTLSSSSAASDVYKRQLQQELHHFIRHNKLTLAVMTTFVLVGLVGKKHHVFGSVFIILLSLALNMALGKWARSSLRTTQLLAMRGPECGACSKAFNKTTRKPCLCGSCGKSMCLACRRGERRRSVPTSCCPCLLYTSPSPRDS
eukprot:TRINITY_DN58414_c0_g1_i1.p1 TRINITY_DN58414_c0_g1~~TRINITY_DN58414_c0_g1_i1.p1  ORF type:complete len:151 (+),score=15.56 TRINITY_DN58414_c0_g1_i1:90-542(+)